jgi:hypothetical protein
MGVEAKSMWCLIDMTEADLIEEADEMDFLVKMIDLSAKVPYNKHVLKPEQIVPFMVKDRQEIVCKRFDKLFSINYLMTTKVLLDIFPLHDFKGIHTIYRTLAPDSSSSLHWLYKYVPHVFRNLSDWLFEDMNTKFAYLTAQKNYFGEKRTIINAFFDFYAAWFLFPAVLAVPLIVYQYRFVEDTQYCMLFAIFVAFWAQILIESWKRKEKFIALQWGIVTQGDRSELMPNDDFKGYNHFSWTTHEADKKSRGKWSHVARYLNTMLMIVLVSLSIFVYIKLQDLPPLLQGIFLNAAVGAINFGFRLVTVYLMKHEDHKYKAHYTSSLTTKLAFFKFVNIHLPIVYALIRQRLHPAELSSTQQATYQALKQMLGYPAAEMYRS